MATTEQTPQAEILSPQELSKRSHVEIRTIVRNLLSLPNFTDAASRAYFKRSDPEGEEPKLADGVRFSVGQFYYQVKYHSEPIHKDLSVDKDYIAKLRLVITKHDSGSFTVIEGDTVGSVSLETSFIEDRFGHIEEFLRGNVKVREYDPLATRNPSASSLPMKEYENTSEAYDMISKVFGDLYPDILL